MIELLFMIIFLQANSRKLYELCLSAIQMYSKHNLGRSNKNMCRCSADMIMLNGNISGSILFVLYMLMGLIWNAYGEITIVLILCLLYTLCILVHEHVYTGCNSHD